MPGDQNPIDWVGTVEGSFISSLTFRVSLPQNYPRIENARAGADGDAFGNTGRRSY
jgi:hypothetical protein